MENSSQQPAAHPPADVVSAYIAAKDNHERCKVESNAAYAAAVFKRNNARAFHVQRAVAEYKYWAVFAFDQQVLLPLRQEHRALIQRRFAAEQELLTAVSADRVAQLALEIRRLTLQMEAIGEKSVAIQKAQLESIGDFRPGWCQLESQHLIWLKFERNDAIKAEEAARQEIEPADDAWSEAHRRQWEARKALETATKAKAAAAEQYAIEQAINTIAL